MKVFITFCFLTVYMYAQDISATYKVSFGLFGKIGVATANLHVQNSTYEINMHAKATGLAGVLSGGREEWFSSKGTIDKEGFLVPNEYKKIVQRNKNIGSFDENKIVQRRDIRTYTILHEQKKVEVLKEKSDDGVVDSSSQEQLEYYAKDDLLSLFFNFKKLVPLIEKSLTLHAVGANKSDGRIDLEKVVDYEKVKDEFSWKDGVYLKVTLNDKIFSSDKGELLVNLNEKGIAQSAVLKDVLLFGDIRGDLVE